MKGLRRKYILALLLLLLAATGYYFFAPARTPSGQLALTNLHSRGFESFETLFDDAADRVRIVALFSPTCPTCLDGASALQNLLREFPNAPVSLFVVWEPMPGREALGRVPDLRAMQFWDRDRQVSKQIPVDSKDFVAVYAAGFRWKDSGKSPVFAAGPVIQAIPDLREQLRAAGATAGPPPSADSASSPADAATQIPKKP